MVVHADPKETGKPINFQDQNNQLTQYKDDVFEIFSLKYGVTIRADSDSVEVTTYQHALRNIACGLCGDLNDEATGDVKSAEECVMSSPGLAAYSYMVEDGRTLVH